MQSSEDKILVRRLKSDDLSAFDELYWKYHSALFANIFKLVKKQSETEDILQEVFITLWSQRHTLDAEKDIGGWLFVVSFNKSMSFLRKVVYQSEMEAEIHSVSAANEADENIFENRWSLLQQGLAVLSPQKRKVFELCKLQHKTYEETANELHISKHTVKEYLSEAMALLKKYVKQHPEEYSLLLIIIPTFFS